MTETGIRILGAVLAGGRARRLGTGGKSHLQLGGRSLVEHVIARVRGQVDDLVVNAPAGADWAGGLGLEVVPDLVLDGGIEAFAGPLAGVLSVLEWAAASPARFGAVAVFATDTPFLPCNFVARARTALNGQGTELACAASGGRLHPVIAVWPVGLRLRLRRLVIEDGLRRADAVEQHFRTARVDYPADPFDPFFNVNTPEDLAEAERLLSVMERSG